MVVAEEGPAEAAVVVVEKVLAEVAVLGAQRDPVAPRQVRAFHDSWEKRFKEVA